MENFKIIVAHPGRQHSFRLASAMKKNQMLQSYITTLYNKKNSLMFKLLELFLKQSDKKRLKNRKNVDLEDKEVLQFCKFRGLLETFLFRVDKSKKIYRRVQQKNADKFGIKVAKYAIKNNVDAVVMYDTNALACFKYLEKKAPEIKRIMDVSHSPRCYEKELFEKEMENSKNDTIKKENELLWETKTIERLNNEIKYTEHFVVPSRFVMEGLKYCGVLEKNVHIVPYGNNVRININKLPKATDELNLIFVGQVTYRKGISYLLDAVSQFQPNEVKLHVVGSYDSDAWYIKPYLKKDNIIFHGSVLFDNVVELYSISDVLVIDSFAEGMAQVGIEAMYCGLPIICSVSSGVSDLITDGKEGFIINSGSVDELKEKINWFVDNKNKIELMSEEARKTAQKYTWDLYEKNVFEAIKKILNEDDECGK